MDISKIEQQLKREQDKQRESARKAQALGAKLSVAKRRQDTHRKILAGVWALDQAERSADFNAGMLRDLDRIWLHLDKDRAAFGLPPLPAPELARRREHVKQLRGGAPSSEPARTNDAAERAEAAAPGHAAPLGAPATLSESEAA